MRQARYRVGAPWAREARPSGRDSGSYYWVAWEVSDVQVRSGPGLKASVPRYEACPRVTRPSLACLPRGPCYQDMTAERDCCCCR